MNRIETFRLGCETILGNKVGREFGPGLHGHAHPRMSQIIRYDSKNSFATANILSPLHRACHYAESVSNEILFDGEIHKAVSNGPPCYVSIFLHEICKRKETDVNTNYDTIKFFIEHLKPPKDGIIFTVYEMGNYNRDVVTPFQLTYLWPFKDEWKPSGHITLQIPEENMDDDKYMKARYEYMEVKEILKDYDYPVYEIDYSMPIEEIYNKIMTTNLHISYTGASYYIAGAAKIPMLSYGPGAGVGHQYCRDLASHPDWNMDYEFEYINEVNPENKKETQFGYRVPKHHIYHGFKQYIEPWHKDGTLKKMLEYNGESKGVFKKKI